MAAGPFCPWKILCMAALWSKPTTHTLSLQMLLQQGGLFLDTEETEQVARGSNGGPRRAARTVLRSHKGTVSLTSRWRWVTPLRNVITMEFKNTDFCWMSRWNAEIAASCTLNELNERPEDWRCNRSSIMSWVQASIGWIFHSSDHTETRLHLTKQVALVKGLLLLRTCQTASEHHFSSSSSHAQFWELDAKPNHGAMSRDHDEEEEIYLGQLATHHLIIKLVTWIHSLKTTTERYGMLFI